MKIYSVNDYNPKDRPWVTRMLRYLGYMIVFGCILYGIYYGVNIINLSRILTLNVEHNLNTLIGAIVGGFLGFVGGLVVSVPYWGLAMLLDDIRAIRVQTAEYVAVDKGEHITN